MCIEFNCVFLLMDALKLCRKWKHPIGRGKRNAVFQNQLYISVHHSLFGGLIFHVFHLVLEEFQRGKLCFSWCFKWNTCCWQCWFFCQRSWGFGCWSWTISWVLSTSAWNICDCEYIYYNYIANNYVTLYVIMISVHLHLSLLLLYTLVKKVNLLNGFRIYLENSI